MTVRQSNSTRSLRRRFPLLARMLGMGGKSKSNYAGSIKVSENCSRTAHTSTAAEILALLSSDAQTGLSRDDVEERLEEHGPNQLQGAGGVSAWKVLLAQIANALMVVLVAALILSLVVKDWIEAGCILAVMILNTLIGFVQEYRAEKTMESLRQLASPTATVVRNDGHEEFIAAVDLVPGDIVLVKMGDIIPADARLIEVFNLEVSESMLTGESEPVRKNPSGVKPSNTPLGDCTNMIFTGTTVTKGRGRAVVVGTGMDSQMGKIAQSLSESDGKGKTQLQRKLDKFAFALLGCGAVLGVIVFSVNRFKFSNDVAMYAISTGIAIIPESLVAVVTITMAVGVRQMAKQHALVRKMMALEQLGSVDHICSDKTGTLTSGKMVMREFVLSNGMRGSVDGAGIEPEGAVHVLGADANRVRVDLHEAKNLPRELQKLAVCVSMCNMATLKFKAAQKQWVAMGDSTEIALACFAGKLGLSRAHLQEQGREIVAEFPFDSAIKKMSVIVRNHRLDTYEVYVKGAVEKVFGASTAVLDYDRRIAATEFEGEDAFRRNEGEEVLTRALEKDRDGKQMASIVDKLAEKGLRVLAAGCRTLTKEEVERFGADNFSQLSREDVDVELTFLGLVGIQDPPREDTADSVRACQEAGITVHMLTGDHGRTARAIAKEIGILPADYDGDADEVSGGANGDGGYTPAPPPPRDIPLDSRTMSNASSIFRFAKKRDNVVVKIRNPMVMDGRDFDALTHEQIDAFIELPRVISRCSPDTKVNMVAAMKRRKKVVAMTGDGVNDAPSLKSADVGIAMGMGGSDVTKSASDLVLTTDNFSTIVHALQQGRRIYHNLEKFISHLLATNVAEVLALIIGLAFQDAQHVSIPPMAPIQILFLNMITSSPPAIALGMDKASPRLMKMPPRKHNTFLPHETMLDTVVLGVVIGVLILATFVIEIYVLGTGVLDSRCNTFDAELEGHCLHIFKARGAAFTTGLVLALVHAFACRENRLPIWTNRWAAVCENKVLLWSILFGCAIVMPTLYVPKFNTLVFRQAPLDGIDWLLVVASTFIYFACVEIYKYAKRLHYARADVGKHREAIRDGFKEHVLHKPMPQGAPVELMRQNVDKLDHILEMQRMS